VLDLNIDQLRLNIDNAAGHERRVRPIVTRALELAAERLSVRAAEGRPRPPHEAVGRVDVAPVRVALGRMTDEQAASAIADALLEELALHLGL
jgi:hypothetical protein